MIPRALPKLTTDALHAGWTTPPRCGHLSRIGTHCYRPAGHTGPHVAAFTDRNG